MERTGWSLTDKVSQCIFDRWRVSDHPVCAVSEASQLILQAQPPLLSEEGNMPLFRFLPVHAVISVPPGTLARKSLSSTASSKCLRVNLECSRARLSANDPCPLAMVSMSRW